MGVFSAVLSLLNNTILRRKGCVGETGRAPREFGGDSFLIEYMGIEDLRLKNSLKKRYWTQQIS